LTADSTHVLTRLGDVYNDMPTTTKAADVIQFITDAQSVVDNYTGSQTGALVDSAVADLAAAYCTVSATGGKAVGLKYSLGQMSVDRPKAKFEAMAEKLMKSAMTGMQLLGKKARHTVVNG